MTRRNFRIASPHCQPTVRDFAGGCSEPRRAAQVGAAHLDALLRGLAFVAAILWLTLPMAVAGRCSQPPRDFAKALAEQALSQGRQLGGSARAVSSR